MTWVLRRLFIDILSVRRVINKRPLHQQPDRSMKTNISFGLISQRGENCIYVSPGQLNLLHWVWGHFANPFLYFDMQSIPFSSVIRLVSVDGGRQQPGGCSACWWDSGCLRAAGVARSPAAATVFRQQSVVDPSLISHSQSPVAWKHTVPQGNAVKINVGQPNTDIAQSSSLNFIHLHISIQYPQGQFCAFYTFTFIRENESCTWPGMRASSHN